MIETRLTGSDSDRARIWERVHELPSLYEVATGHLRDELTQRVAHSREVITQRLDDLDRAAKIAAEHIDKIPADNQRDAAALAADFRESMRAEREFITAQIDAVQASVPALRNLIEQRLGAMDLAAQVLARSIEKFPSDLDRAVSNVREVLLGETKRVQNTTEEKFTAVSGSLENIREVLLAEIKRVQSVTEEKFTAIDGTFSSNALALTAALAAQKEAAAEQNKSNTLAITKSESSTKETIAANAVQAQTGLASLENQFDDIKERVVRIESAGVGDNAAPVRGPGRTHSAARLHAAGPVFRRHPHLGSVSHSLDSRSIPPLGCSPRS